MAYQLTKTEDWEKAIKEAFEKSDDPNIVWKYEAKRSEIWLDKLEQNIKTLQEQIDNASKMIEYPEGASDEVKQAIDEHNMTVGDVEEIEKQKTELERIKEEVTKLGVK
jgi:chromosome segregation ATPase